MNTLDDLEAALDGRGEMWDLYRAAIGVWIIDLGNPHSDNRRQVTGATISQTLVAALASPALPTYPRRPKVYDYPTPHKRGSKWEISNLQYNISTRKAAEELIEKWKRRDLEAIADWDQKYGPLTYDKTEGQDFRWKD